MSDVLGIVPARVGSKGVPLKNFRALGSGPSPIVLAARCAWDAGIDDVYVSTDHPTFQGVITPDRSTRLIRRPPELAQDDTPMRAVVDHVLETIPGPPDQIILLVQPTQPLRQPKHLAAAIALLESSVSGSVVSVVETESPDKLMSEMLGGWLIPWTTLKERRQDCKPAWRRDGTVYAWRRQDRYWLQPWHMLVIPPEESQALDTPFDWAMAELRLRG